MRITSWRVYPKGICGGCTMKEEGAGVSASGGRISRRGRVESSGRSAAALLGDHWGTTRGRGRGGEGCGNTHRLFVVGGGSGDDAGAAAGGRGLGGAERSGGRPRGETRAPYPFPEPRRARRRRGGDARARRRRGRRRSRRKRTCFVGATVARDEVSRARGQAGVRSPTPGVRRGGG